MLKRIATINVETLPIATEFFFSFFLFVLEFDYLQGLTNIFQSLNVHVRGRN